MLNPVEQYGELMVVVRNRFDIIRTVRTIEVDPFAKAEIAAFHGRKIVEAIAFGCLIAIEHGLKKIPRDAQGQWNADTILSRLESKNLNAFPSPSIIRNATDTEKATYDVAVTIEGQPDLRLTRAELREIYSEFHKWLHEINPYVEKGRRSFLERYEQNLWHNLSRLEAFLARHTISIAGQMMFCVLRDSGDGATKVRPLSKNASLW